MNILEYRRKALGYTYREGGDYEDFYRTPVAPAAKVAPAAPVATPAAPAAPAAPVAITGTHQEYRENQEGGYYVEVPNTQAYLDTQNQKAATAAALATQRQADASLQAKSQIVATKLGGTAIYTGGDVAARLYQGDEVEAASYSPLALAGYSAPTGTKGYSYTYDAQGNYTGIVNTSPSGFINQLSDSLAQLDSDLGLSKNAPLIVALAINTFVPGAGAAIGQSLVNAGLVTGAQAATTAALAGGASATAAAAAGAAATAFATTVGSTVLNAGIQMATGVSPEKALTSAVLSVAGAAITPSISGLVKDVVENTTATNIITNAVVSAGKTAVTGGDVSDAFVGSMASGIANVGADKIISGLSVNDLPKEAVSIIKEGIVGTILTGDGTTAMTNAAINAGVTAAVNAVADGTISLSNSVVNTLNNIATTTAAEIATQDTITSGAGADTVTGAATTTQDTLTGGTGADTLAGTGADTLAGSTTTPAQDIAAVSPAINIGELFNVINTQGTDAANAYLKANNITSDSLNTALGGDYQGWISGMGLRGSEYVAPATEIIIAIDTNNQTALTESGKVVEVDGTVKVGDAVVGTDTIAGGADTVAAQDTSFLGYPSFKEWQDATNDQFAKDRSFPDFATYTQYGGDSGAYNTAQTSIANAQTATDAGFPDFSAYTQYGGNIGAYNTAQTAAANLATAQAAGFPDYASYAQFDGNLAAYDKANNDAANIRTATMAGFPDYATFLQYGGNFSEYSTAKTAEANRQIATAAGFPDYATYTQYNGDNAAYTAANSGSAITSNDTASVSNASVDDLVNPINTVAPTIIPTGGLSALSDASLAVNNQNNITLDTDDLAGKTELKADAIVGGLTGNTGSDASTELPATGGLTQVQQDLLNPVDTDALNNAGNETVVPAINPAIADNTVVAATPVVEDVAEAVSSVPGGSPVGGLTQAQKDLIEDKANDGTTVGGLNQVAATGNDATTVAKVADSNVLSNILKKIVISTASGAAKNLIKKAVAPKRTAMPSVAKKLTGSALNQMRSNVAPKTVDISKLAPVKNRPVSLKADVSKLTPVTNISRLSSSTKG